MAITEAEPCESTWRIASMLHYLTETDDLYSCRRKWSTIVVGTHSSDSTSRQSGKSNRLVDSSSYKERGLIYYL
jgi:hypothetical protein